MRISSDVSRSLYSFGEPVSQRVGRSRKRLHSNGVASSDVVRQASCPSHVIERVEREIDKLVDRSGRVWPTSIRLLGSGSIPVVFDRTQKVAAMEASGAEPALKRPEIQLPRYLFIVSRENRAMYDYLRGHFTDAPEVDVVLDRRHTDRRRNDSTVPFERRRTDRRARPEIDQRLRSETHVFLSLT
jgi:hypothetical protein